MNTGNALEQTQNWVREIVVGLGLCPFAAQPLLQKKVGFFLFAGNDPGDLMRCLLELAADMLERPASELETALLVHPECLTDFEEYLDFVYEAEAVFAQTGLEGILQIASFHPDYCFEGAPAGDPANFTNRSPFPMLHLLREASLEAALSAYPDPERIPDRNIALLRSLGWERIVAVWRSVAETGRGPDDQPFGVD